MRRRKSKPAHIPAATYRLQLNHWFPFDQAKEIVAYLDELGISDVYASPFLMARPGSLHGYDVTDHSRFNPEIGDREAFLEFSGELQRHAMSLLVDVVPNHMCITHPSNVWWWDVLENGPSGPFARYFDIDWHPPKEELTNKVLLPVLGDQYGRVLENQEIQAVFDRGQFQISLYDRLLPLGPRTWSMLLEPALAKLRDRLDPAHEYVAELESILTAVNHLPGQTETDEAKIRERLREKEIIKRRLWGLVEASPDVAGAIQAALVEINGQRGDPHSFDRLERLLEGQSYRLSYWRVAMDEINYRRFFDINDLAAIRPEDPEVFSAIHALIFDLVKEGRVSGLRVDHPDGLFDPEKYFRFLQDACRAQAAPSANGNGSAGTNGGGRSFYVVAEKILMRNESLRTSWPIEGTTGYDFLNLLNGLFVDRTRRRRFISLYRRFTGWSEDFQDLASDSKRLILQVAMSSELNVLARKLDHISEQHRWSRDFTLESLRDALREVLATFPCIELMCAAMPRSWIAKTGARSCPRFARPRSAIRPSANRCSTSSKACCCWSIPTDCDALQRAERQAFVTRFQQLSAPVMAKGLEDTVVLSLLSAGLAERSWAASGPVRHFRELRSIGATQSAQNCGPTV